MGKLTKIMRQCYDDVSPAFVRTSYAFAALKTASV